MTDTWHDIHAGVLAQVRGYEQARARNASLHPLDPVPPREPESRERFAHGDVDITGLVSPARVLERLQHARVLHLAACGLDLAAELRRARCTWQAREQSVLVDRPIRPLDELRLRTRLLDFGPDHTWVEGLVLDPSGHVLRAISWTHSAWIDTTTGRTADHPAPIADLLRQLRLGPPQTPDLRARLAAVQYELRRRP